MAVKEKAARIDGRKTTKYDVKVGDDVFECEIQEPTFDQISAALSQTKKNGNIDMIACGKVIWELCCVSFSEELEKNSKILISLCIDLANDYAMPISVELKKK